MRLDGLYWPLRSLCAALSLSASYGSANSGETRAHAELGVFGVAPPHAVPSKNAWHAKGACARHVLGADTVPHLVRGK